MKRTLIRKVLIASLTSILLGIGLTALPASAVPLATRSSLFNASATTTSGPYLHWNCGGQSQCQMVWGGPTGVFPEGTGAKCKTILNTWIRQNTMQIFNGTTGAWCDKVSSKTEKRPHK